MSAQPVGLGQSLGFGLIQTGLGPLCAIDSFELRHGSQGCSGGLPGALSGPHLCCRTLLTVADFTTQWVQRRMQGIRRFRAEQGWAFPSLSPAYREFSLFRLRVSPILQSYGIASPLTTPQPACLVPIHLGYAVAPGSFSSLRILKGRDSSSLPPPGASTGLPTTVRIWRFPRCGLLPV